jgi:hypothetical protein
MESSSALAKTPESEELEGVGRQGFSRDRQEAGLAPRARAMRVVRPVLETLGDTR